MERSKLPKRIPGSIAVGEKAAFSRTLTEADTALFIGITWDVNPYHTDDNYAQASQFRRRIVPGLLTASMLTHLGGLWAFLAKEMKFKFVAPVYVGDTIRAEMEVVDVDQTRGEVQLRCRCVNDDDQEVLRADISGFPGQFDD